MNDNITVTPRADETYVVLSGRIDSHEVVRLAEILDEDASGDASNTVYLDLSAVTFVDRSALVALRVGRERRRAAGGDLHVIALSDAARVIFELCELGTDLLPEVVAARRRQAAGR